MGEKKLPMICKQVLIKKCISILDISYVIFFDIFLCKNYSNKELCSIDDVQQRLIFLSAIWKEETACHSSFCSLPTRQSKIFVNSLPGSTQFQPLLVLYISNASALLNYRTINVQLMVVWTCT